MPLFLPSDPDKFPTEELKKVVKPSPSKPEPKDTWVEVKPGIFQNGLGQKKTEDKKPPEAALTPAVRKILQKPAFPSDDWPSIQFPIHLQYLVKGQDSFDRKYDTSKGPVFNNMARLSSNIQCCEREGWPWRLVY